MSGQEYMFILLLEWLTPGVQCVELNVVQFVKIAWLNVTSLRVAMTTHVLICLHVGVPWRHSSETARL